LAKNDPDERVVPPRLGLSIRDSNVDHELGVIQGCVNSIKDDLNAIRKETTNIFARLLELEKSGVSREERLIEAQRRIEEMCQEIKDEKQKEYERQKMEKEQESARTNTKIAIVALVLTTAEILFAIFIAAYHV
jgi:seryl-tRNA synthetase